MKRPSARRLAQLVAGVALLAALSYVWHVFGGSNEHSVVAGPYVWHVFGGSNEHSVVAGQYHRCSQLSPARLEATIARLGIRTVVNLRGTAQTVNHPKSAWYKGEAETTAAAEVSQEDITLSAYLLPPPAEIRRLVDVLDHSPKPILFHCKQGADRTGLAAAMVVLLYTDGTLATARRELWPIYGHFPVGRTTAMDDFLDRYERSLDGEPHTPARFRDWVLSRYVAGPARSELAWLAKPADARVGKPFALTLRATNGSGEAWHFEPGNHAAIHVLFKVSGAEGVEFARGQAGLLRRTVAPGAGIDLTLAIPPLAHPGQYTIIAELIDARGCGVPIRSSSFVKLGDDCAMTEVIVR